MAINRFSGTSLDSATDPDDTELVAAPGAGQYIFLKWVLICVQTGQTSGKVALGDGAGGGYLIAVDASSPGSFLFEFPGEGLQLSANTALNGTVEGATSVVATVSGEYTR